MLDARKPVIILSPAAGDLLQQVKDSGGRLDTAGLNGRYVVELLAAGTIEVQEGVMVVIPRQRCQT